MSITDLSNINVEDERPTFDRLKIEKGEKLRLCVPSSRIAQYQVHTVHSDIPEMKEMSNGRMKPEWEQSSYAGGYICTGDVKKVSKNPRFGDPDNCAACAAMQDTTRPQLVEVAKKTFAMNCIQYNVKPGSYDVRNRNVEVKVWKHGDSAKLQPVQLASTQTELKEIDFLIECGNDMYKKLNINVDLGGAAYLKDEKLKEAVEELIANELYSDEVLTQACGRQVTAEELENEINQLFRQYEAQFGSSSAPTNGNGSGHDETSEPVEEMEGLSVSTLSSLLED